MGDDEGMTAHYAYPYPSPETLAVHPFEPLDFTRFDESTMRQRSIDFYAQMNRRRSVRMLSDEPVPIDLIETAIRTASSAPSGAHLQPWRFVVIGNPTLKKQIREAAEEEERINYLENRMNEHWQQALAPIGTDHHKEFLEFAPWIVVLFEERFRVDADGTKRNNYYVKESCGIAAGLFIAALHHAGLATLTHTPSPMAFLTKLLGRPSNERPFVLFPIGYPLDGVLVPSLERKPLAEVMTLID